MEREAGEMCARRRAGQVAKGNKGILWGTFWPGPLGHTLVDGGRDRNAWVFKTRCSKTRALGRRAPDGKSPNEVAN